MKFQVRSDQWHKDGMRDMSIYWIVTYCLFIAGILLSQNYNNNTISLSIILFTSPFLIIWALIFLRNYLVLEMRRLHDN